MICHHTTSDKRFNLNTMYWLMRYWLTFKDISVLLCVSRGFKESIELSPLWAYVWENNAPRRSKRSKSLGWLKIARVMHLKRNKFKMVFFDDPKRNFLRAWSFILSHDCNGGVSKKCTCFKKFGTTTVHGPKVMVPLFYPGGGVGRQTIRRPMEFANYWNTIKHPELISLCLYHDSHSKPRKLDYSFTRAEWASGFHARFQNSGIDIFSNVREVHLLHCYNVKTLPHLGSKLRVLKGSHFSLDGKGYHMAGRVDVTRYPKLAKLDLRDMRLKYVDLSRNKCLVEVCLYGTLINEFTLSTLRHAPKWCCVSSTKVKLIPKTLWDSYFIVENSPVGDILLEWRHSQIVPPRHGTRTGYEANAYYMHMDPAPTGKYIHDILIQDRKSWRVPPDYGWHAICVSVRNDYYGS